MDTTGAGTSIVSKRISKSGWVRVSPVEGPFKTNNGAYVTCLYLLHVFTLVCVELYDSSDPLILTLGAIENSLTGFQLTRVNPHVAQLPHEGIIHDFEDKAAEGLIVGAFQMSLFSLFCPVFVRRNIGR